MGLEVPGACWGGIRGAGGGEVIVIVPVIQETPRLEGRSHVSLTVTALHTAAQKRAWMLGFPIDLSGPGSVIGNHAISLYNPGTCGLGKGPSYS